ncbi:MAG TPA: tRNA guanosine(34) transglycosylase Tgt [Thermoanaerobaculia bacterium]|nr:tRNA guanosine(34) transglycosylase Tgt [Thermoanaerobaculia bacterium]
MSAAGPSPVGAGAAIFELLARDGSARRGRLTTAHGVVETPCFMPVGTLGAVKGLGPQQLEEAGATVMLANLYHLALRPGIETIERVGGLHRFCGWSRTLATDSGGFQVFSLSDRRSVDDDGVEFKSHLDGSTVRLTPESVVEMQERIGVDLAMVLDECPPWPVTEAAAESALDRTLTWARRSRERHRGGPTALFGIVQGSTYPRLRQRAIEELEPLDFDGYAIGGVAVGEGAAASRDVVGRFAAALPDHKPRYLMGLGTPEDILHGVRCGVDLFDCVLPARNARHGLLYTRAGLLRIRNAVFRDDDRPLDPDCACPACLRVSRALVHHLIRSGEITGQVLATLHNVRFFLDFMGDLRQAVASGSLRAATACSGSVNGSVTQPSERSPVLTQRRSDR